MHDPIYEYERWQRRERRNRILSAVVAWGFIFAAGVAIGLGAIAVVGFFMGALS